MRHPPKSTGHCPLAGLSLRPFLTCFALLLAALSSSSSLAQTAATGAIQGRVFNPATQQYVRNAEIQIEGTNLTTYSRDDGSYDLANVPAGEVTLTVTYTGYQRATSRVTLGAGQTAVRDFDLKGAVFESATKPAAGQSPGLDVVTLAEFSVSAEREGNAKAIMEQRAALNMKSVVASDNFGDVTGGNIGEFIKYLPGVVMDYVDSDARTARIGGLSRIHAIGVRI